ncbi:hypothetical protein ACIA3K_18965 [Micromonospora sp. NPDC051543]
MMPPTGAATPLPIPAAALVPTVAALALTPAAELVPTVAVVR